MDAMGSKRNRQEVGLGEKTRWSKNRRTLPAVWIGGLNCVVCVAGNVVGNEPGWMYLGRAVAVWLTLQPTTTPLTVALTTAIVAPASMYLIRDYALHK
jgi:hypothetical protein